MAPTPQPGSQYLVHTCVMSKGSRRFVAFGERHDYPFDETIMPFLDRLQHFDLTVEHKVYGKREGDDFDYPHVIPNAQTLEKRLPQARAHHVDNRAWVPITRKSLALWWLGLPFRMVLLRPSFETVGIFVTYPMDLVHTLVRGAKGYVPGKRYSGTSAYSNNLAGSTNKKHYRTMKSLMSLYDVVFKYLAYATDPSAPELSATEMEVMSVVMSERKQKMTILNLVKLGRASDRKHVKALFASLDDDATAIGTSIRTPNVVLDDLLELQHTPLSFLVEDTLIDLSMMDLYTLLLVGHPSTHPVVVHYAGAAHTQSVCRTLLRMGWKVEFDTMEEGMAYSLSQQKEEVRTALRALLSRGDGSVPKDLARTGGTPLAQVLEWIGFRKTASGRWELPEGKSRARYERVAAKLRRPLRPTPPKKVEATFDSVVRHSARASRAPEWRFDPMPYDAGEGKWSDPDDERLWERWAQRP